MKKILILVIIAIFIVGCSTTEPPDTNNVVSEAENNQEAEANNETIEAKTKKVIGISIVPQETFIKAITGDAYEVVTLIPPGSSPATHQPSIKTLQKLSDAELYFSVGVPTEKSNITPMLKEYDHLKIISLAEKVDEIYPPRFFGAKDEHDHEEEAHDEHAHDDHDHSDEATHDNDHDDHDEEATDDEHDDHNHEGRDPHIWLSPKRAIAMVEIMTEELIKTYPDDEDLFIENSENYIKAIEGLDEYIQERVKAVQTIDFIIYHPSYGYLADDYGLNMIEIEYDGKEANINELNRIIELANEKNINTIYYQEEMSVKQAKIVANELNGQVVKLTPLNSDYIESQKRFIDTLVGE